MNMNNDPSQRKNQDTNACLIELFKFRNHINHNTRDDLKNTISWCKEVRKQHTGSGYVNLCDWRINKPIPAGFVQIKQKRFV